MAEQATRKKPPTRPSLLRHEIRPDSTDDNGDSQGDVVQAPHSDTIVFGTQLDPCGHNSEHTKSKDSKPDFSEPPLSPNSQVTLKRFGATKKTIIPESDTTLFKTFSKETAEPDSWFDLLSHPFSYGRAVRKTSQPNTKIGHGEPQPAALATSKSLTNEERSDEKTHASVAPATIANRVSQESPGNISNVLNVTRKEEPHASIPQPQAPTTDDHLNQPSHSGSTRPKTTTLFPLPMKTIPKSQNETGRSIGFGKHRKSAKTSLVQQHIRPWPPQRNDALDDAQPLIDVKRALPNDSTDVLNPEKLEKYDEQSKDLSGDDGMLRLAGHDSDKPVPSYQVQKLDTRKDTKAEHGTKAYDTTEGASFATPPRPLDTLAPPPVSASPLLLAPVINKQCFAANLEQEDLKEDHSETSRCSHERITSNNQALIPPSESHNDTVLCTGGSGDHLRVSQLPSRVNENLQPPTSPLIASQEALHRTSNRGVPSRIVKPRMKSRTDSKSISHGAQGAFISPVVDRALKSLEMALLAESFRVTHEHTTELEHAAEKVTLHLQTIDSQKEVIVELRKQRDELKIAFESLTSKAKTNQKFLEGFQKDYEKLKKLTTIVQEDNKKTLQAKIAEVEEEKHILGRELEMTACKLAKSQTKIRAVVEELYAKLAITLSANEGLAKKINELEEAYKSEKKKREDVESELLNGVQDLQCQFSSTSNDLVDKLEQFQTSVGKTAIYYHQDTKTKECLEILNSLKMSPFLKVQDVRKAEGMLCFVRTSVQSGLEDLRKAITCSGLSNADLYASIKEQLHDLRANMMRYEEIATENHKIKESNFVLKQQLEAQTQACTHLNEKLEHLKRVENDLKDRSSELEHKLSSMETATRSSRLEMSAVEQTNRDLRQQLKEMENELVAAKAKADDAEESRKTLEAQAAAYKTRYEATVKERMAEKQSAATTCEKLSEEFKLKLSEKQQELQNEISGLKAELDVKEAACQQLSEELSIANAHLDELRQRVDDQKDANNKLQSQVSQEQSAMKVMCQEADQRASQKQQETHSMLELAQNKVLLLENEKQTMISELSQACKSERRMKRVEEAISAEKNSLHQDIRNLHSVIDNKDAEIAGTRSECANQHQKVIEQCRDDVENYKRRLAETTTSFKEAEANTKLLEEHYQVKIATDQKITESKLLELEKEYHNALKLAKEQSSTIERHCSHDASSNPYISQSGQKLPTCRGRRRVERDNRSVIEATQEQNHSRGFSTLPYTEGSQAQSDDQDLFATFIDDIDNSIQVRANGELMANHECDLVPTSQDSGVLPFSQALFMERQVETAKKELPYQPPSSSEFSSVASDELARLQKEAESALTTKLHGRNFDSHRLEASPDNEKTEISHMDNISVTSSNSSQSKERPGSQANTSCRMMPPHGSASKQIQPPRRSQVIRIKLPSQHKKLDSIRQKPSDSNSPDKRKLSTSQADSDLSLKRQCVIPFSQPEFSSSGLRRRSPRLSRRCVGGSGLSESDTWQMKGDLSKSPLSRSQGRFSDIRSSNSNHTSSDKTHLSRQQLSQTYTASPKRHSSRVTRNQSRNGTAFEDDFNGRFDKELQELH